MNVPEIMKTRLSCSFEVFPPKADQPLEPLLDCLDNLYALKPDFISCTYGAGGTNAGRNAEICKAIYDSGKTISVTHFTCVGNSRAQVKDQLDNYLASGVDHILALRGDIPAGWEGTRGDFSHANELIEFIKVTYGDKFVVAMSGAPEKHIEAPTFEADITHMRRKQDCGADYIMTQLCFDTEAYKRWYDMIRRAGITLPIDVGVMPVLNKDATIRMALSMNGCSIPRGLAEVISRYYNDSAGFKSAGIQYTVNQIFDYLCLGIEGLHLYTLNKYADVAQIVQETGLR